jgi:replication-associated recombination protein RarA
MTDTALSRGPLTEQFRPRTWGDVVGQDKVVQRVQALAHRGLAVRAYWISGQSGTGKTTIGRPIAAEVANELFIWEVDAAGLVADLKTVGQALEDAGLSSMPSHWARCATCPVSLITRTEMRVLCTSSPT